MKIRVANFADFAPKLVAIETYLEQSENKGKIDEPNAPVCPPILKIW